MALNFWSKGFPKRRDHPPPLGNTSNNPFAVCPPNMTSPDQQPSEGIHVPSAILSVLRDGANSPNLSFDNAKVSLQIEFTMAPSSNRPSISNATPFSPFNLTACTNGRTAISEVFPPTAHRSMQLLFDSSNGT